jgi:hypothetical protein
MTDYCPRQAKELRAKEGVPEGLKQETESAFCFLCEQPRRLVVPQQIKGQHKIWPLPAAIAKQFAPALKVVPPVRSPTRRPEAFHGSPCACRGGKAIIRLSFSIIYPLWCILVSATAVRSSSQACPNEILFE